LERLDELEAEEEKLEKEGFYDSDDFDDEEIAESDEEAIRETAKAIRARRTEIKTNNKIRDKKQNRSAIPRPQLNTRTMDAMAQDLRKAGIDPSKLEERAKMLALARGVQLKSKTAGEKRKRAADGEDDEEMEIEEGESSMAGASASMWADASDDEGDGSMEIDGASSSKKRRSLSGKAVAANNGKRVPTKNRATLGMRDETQRKKATQLHRLAQRHPNRMAKAGEADRHVPTKMPKHLFAGKRGIGKTSHR
jgi:nucleolar GTP-binding protein